MQAHVEYDGLKIKKLHNLQQQQQDKVLDVCEQLIAHNVTLYAHSHRFFSLLFIHTFMFML